MAKREKRTTTPKAYKRLVIDEGVSLTALNNFKAHASKLQISWQAEQNIKHEHQGIPDALIVQKLLSAETLFVTSDRPLHNTVLEKELASYYLQATSFTTRRLSGIQTKKLPEFPQKLELKDSYVNELSPLAFYMNPIGMKQLENMRTKRRRIRNYCEGHDNISEMTYTISAQKQGSGTLIGIRANVATNIGKKGIMATEHYLHERIPLHKISATAFCHTFILSLNLQLNPQRTSVYYDGAVIQMPTPDSDEPLMYQLYEALVQSHPKLTFSAVIKGRHMEMLRSKLYALVHTPNTNEIVPGNIKQRLGRFEEYQKSLTEPNPEETSDSQAEDPDEDIPF